MITEKQFEKRLAELLNNIRSKTTVFQDNEQDDIEKRIEQGKSFYNFAKTYFPHYCDKPFGTFQKACVENTNSKKQIVAIAGPRGFGKSVLLAIIKPIWGALYGKYKFCVFVGESRELSEERTLAIRAEFQCNTRLINDFGEQLNFNIGSEHDFVIKAGIRFLALGYKQAIRGKMFGPYRPDWIVIDDFENINSRNPKIARQKLEYVREEAFGALAQKGSIVWLGNLTHKETAFYMLKVLVQNTDEYLGIKFLCYPAEKDGIPLWPEGGYTLEALETMRQTMGSIGYQRHMLMIPVVEGNIFKNEWFKYYEQNPEPMPQLVTCCDPSFSASGDYKAIITIGIHNAKYYLFDIWIRKTTIDTMFHKLYQIDQQFNTRIYMESTFWQSVLWKFLPEYAPSYGYILPLSKYSSRLSKAQRIERLEPLYEWGNILHPLPRNNDLEMLEEQLRNYPDHAHDDGPDVLAACIDHITAATQPLAYTSVVKRSFRKIPI